VYVFNIFLKLFGSWVNIRRQRRKNKTSKCALSFLWFLYLRGDLALSIHFKSVFIFTTVIIASLKIFINFKIRVILGWLPIVCSFPCELVRISWCFIC